MTIITITLSLTVFLMIFLPLLNREFILKNLSGRLLAVCCIAVMIRALVPVEFPFSRTIPVSRILPSIRDFMRHSVTAGDFSVMIFEIILFLWIAVAVILIVLKILHYLQFYKTIRKLPGFEDKMILDILKSLQEKYPSAKDIKVSRIKLNISPLVVGFRCPVILFPEHQFTQREYEIIMEHEILHCIRHDILIKVATDILCSIYWWNPLFYALRQKIFELIELGNDRQLTAPFSTDERAEYMKCLVDTFKKVSSSSIPFTLTFGNKKEKIMRRRIHLIADFRESSRIRNGFTVTILLLLLWISTSFTMEPYEEPPEEGNYFRMDKDNSYFIQDGDSYEVYYNNEFLYTIDSTKYFESDIPIYQKGEKNE